MSSWLTLNQTMMRYCGNVTTNDYHPTNVGVGVLMFVVLMTMMMMMGSKKPWPTKKTMNANGGEWLVSITSRS